ncbi:hypothetical protein [Burkholderia sp. Ac-20365]|uniref:hypothetical protein n=1 Tax=Burkholderia sp. Ac-20365 TaxID=2703897 RepID=UPI00197B9E87|nr:hypothetical protein [Burkholderia sp. Ac-20365]MBN3764491.1 hypothetical protein [Burkholderia sp. Ac-20365]
MKMDVGATSGLVLVSLLVLLLLLHLLRWHPRFASGLLALPLCGAALTFFAAAKKVSKESGSHRKF